MGNSLTCLVDVLQKDQRPRNELCTSGAAVIYGSYKDRDVMRRSEQSGEHSEHGCTSVLAGLYKRVSALVHKAGTQKRCTNAVVGMPEELSKLSTTRAGHRPYDDSSRDIHQRCRDVNIYRGM